MTACRKVLETYELIEHVLSELSPFELGTTVLVCKAWRTLITQSTRLPNVDVTIPSGFDPLTRYTGVHYEIVELTFHPALTVLTHDRHDSEDYWSQETRICFGVIGDIAALDEAMGTEFASMPPVQTMRFYLEREGIKRYQGRLRAKSGIRVQDVASVVRKLNAKGVWAIDSELYLFGKLLDVPKDTDEAEEDEESEDEDD